MRFVGIDIAAETHVVAVVNQQGDVLVKATPFTEDRAGYLKLRDILRGDEKTLIVMEATGHYWQNLFAWLHAEHFAVVLVNPLRTHRFAGEDLRRAKTDALDAVTIARFAAQKRPEPTLISDEATLQLRELVRLRDRISEEFSDKIRRLHRLVDLGFPEFTRIVKTLSSELAIFLLAQFPTAESFKKQSLERLARMRVSPRHQPVGPARARALIDAAQASVGMHHGPAYCLHIRYLCRDLTALGDQLEEVEREISTAVEAHEIAKLLLTIGGIGEQTAARLVAELGNPSRFRDASALASYIGVVPATAHSGKRQPLHAGISAIGHAALRKALWMPTLSASVDNPWLRSYYQRLRARGKLPKVALVACMRKLLHAVYSVAKNRRPFVPLLSDGRSNEPSSSSQPRGRTGILPPPAA